MDSQGTGLLVLGLGNPILRDDAAGLHATRQARVAVGEGAATFVERCIGGYDLLYETTDYQALLVVDAWYGPGSVPGRVQVLSADDLGARDAPLSAHSLNLPAALELGRRHGYPVPELLGAVVIEVGEACREFGEELTEPVAAAVPVAASHIRQLVEGWSPP